MPRDVSRELETNLDLLMLRRNRDHLCNPVIDVAPAGIDRQTYPLFTALARLGPLSVGELAEQVGIDRSNASRYAARLVDVGLVKRAPHPDDARSVVLAVTPKGARLATRLHETLAAHLGELVKGWPKGVAEGLADGLALLIGSAHERN